MRRRFTSCLLLLLALATTGSKSYGTRHIEFGVDQALMISTLSEPVWSANGARLAFVVSLVDTAENANNQELWLLDVREARLVRLTRHPKNDFSPTFSPGGDTIAFVGNRGSGEDAKSAIWMMSLRGGEPWPVGSLDESVSEVRWSPDGRSLAYVKLDTLPRRVREWRKKRWDAVVEDEPLQFPDLWVMDLASGRSRRLTSGNAHLWYVRWSPDSKRLAFLIRPTGKPDDANLTDIGVVPAAGGSVRLLGGIGDAFAWSPDGRWIAWAAGADRAKYIQKSDLFVAAAAGGAPANLTASFDESAQTPAWSPGSDTLYFHSEQGVSTVVAAVPRTGGPVRLGPDRQADAGAPLIAANGRAAWIQSSPDAASEFWLAERITAAGWRATTINAGTLSAATTRSVQWTSTDGVRVEGLLVRPRGAPAGARLPTIVQLHGSPYGSRASLAFQPTAQLFAAHGWQVLLPNFRASGGYGEAFMVRKRADWGGQDWRDVTTGVDSLVKWGLADGRRLGIWGHSYGGYLTAWAITQTDRFDAAIVSAGAVDLAAHYGQSDIKKYRAYDFEGAPWESPANWAKASPMTHIARAVTPTLIFSSEGDARVPHAQGQQLYQALKARNVPTAFVHYPREGHTRREPRHRADQMLRMVAWWEKWLK